MKLKKKWKIIFLVILIIATLFILLRYIGNTGIKVKEYKIINNNIGNFYGLKIVHVTDLHYGMTNEKKLKKLVKEINLTKPDIVLFTGDLVDKNTEYNKEIDNILIENLKNINAYYGKYYVNGDEDLLIITDDGIMIRLPMEQVKTAGRATQGVRLIKVSPENKVSSVEVVEKATEQDDK